MLVRVAFFLKNILVVYGIDNVAEMDSVVKNRVIVVHWPERGSNVSESALFPKQYIDW